MTFTSLLIAKSVPFFIIACVALIGSMVSAVFADLNTNTNMYNLSMLGIFISLGSIISNVLWLNSKSQNNDKVSLK